MKRLATYIIVLTFISATATLAGCSKKYGIERDIKPLERLDVDIKKGGCGLIRTRNLDLATQLLGIKEWEKLLKDKYFLRRKTSVRDHRLPRLYFFYIYTANMGKTPVVIDKITLKYGDREIPCLSPEEIKKKLHSPSYSLINFSELLNTRTVFTEKYCFHEIDFKNQTVNTGFPFLMPGDKQIRFAVFDWIPVEFREFKLIFILDTLPGTTKKIIDVDFQRIEHRTKGKHFVKPKEKKRRKGVDTDED
mgnify:FL=1